MLGEKTGEGCSKRLQEPLLSAALCRPILSGTVLFFTLSVCLASCDVFVRFAFLVALFSFSLSFFLFSRGRDVGDFRLFSYLLLLVCGALFLSEGIAFVRETLPQQRLTELSSRGEISFCARVQTVREHGDLLLVEEAEGVDLGVYVFAAHGERSVGEVILARGTFRPLSAEDAEERWYRGGVECRFEVEFASSPVTVLQRDSALSRLRNNLLASLSSAKSAPFLRSILLAEDTGASPPLDGWLENLGASHLLALSGLHLGLLTGFLHVFLRALFMHRRLRLFCCVLFGLLFTLLCGAPLSLLRAFGMMAFAFVWELFSWRQNSVQTLFLSASVIVLIDRGAAGDAGFLLSVLATLGILLSLPLFRESFFRSRLSRALEKRGGTALFLRRFLLGVSVTFCTSFSALCFTLPVTASVFSSVAPLSPLFGVVLIPFFTVLLFFAFLFLLSSFCGISFLLPLLARICDVLCFLFYDLTEWLSSLSPLVSLSGAAALAASVALVLFILCCLYYRVRARVAFLALPLFFSVSLAAECLLSLFR